jgi:hypothetical protein
MATKQHRGRKSSGLTSVLFVRAEPWMLERLDKILALDRKTSRGRVTSRADLVRIMLVEKIMERLGP